MWKIIGEDYEERMPCGSRGRREKDVPWRRYRGCATAVASKRLQAERRRGEAST